MKVKDLIVKDEEYQGTKFKTLWVVLEDGSTYKIGTLKQGTNINYINCVHKEFKKN